MDNRVFNVNGSKTSALEATLELAFDQDYGHTAKGYTIHPKYGMILHWTDEKNDAYKPFPTPLSAKEVTPLVIAWLKQEFEAKVPTVELTGWDIDEDHDGHNSRGWRVYCEAWGHVGDMWSAIVAVTPAYMWHGK